MQRTFVALAFALAMTCALATVTPTSYVKAPVGVNLDTNFTNNTKASLILGSATIGDLYIIADGQNTTTKIWAAWLKKLNVKDLTAVNQNMSLEFTSPSSSVHYFNNYIIGMYLDGENGTRVLRAYQQPLTGGAVLPTLNLSTINFNTNATWIPKLVLSVFIGKTIYVFYEVAEKKINLTSFVSGGAAGSNEYTITNTCDGNFTVIWGEALSTGQVFAYWNQGTALMHTVIDLSKGTTNPVAVGNWSSNMVCRLYTTDKKWYGELCYIEDTVNKATNYSIRTSNDSLVPFITTNISQKLSSVYPYGPYLAIFYSETQTTNATTVVSYSYDIWNLDTLNATKVKTQYLTKDDNTIIQLVRIPAGGIYTITYTTATASPTVNATSAVFVGLVLGSSYLASILGFLFTIVAGLFLF